MDTTIIFHVDSTHELRKRAEAIVGRVEEKGYALIRGLFGRDAIGKCTSAVYAYANRAAHLASAGVSKESVRANISKWSIGGTSASQAGISRFMLTMYNPLTCADIFRLHPHFRTLIEVRDTLAMRDEILSDERLPPPLFNGTRVQIYPRGGGFMTAHRDTRAAENLKSVSDAYIQLVLLLTQKGVDYRAGGAYIRREAGEAIDTEAGSRAGDVLVFDGNSLHGVEDIDPELTFTASDLSGRAVALATIYN
ncbi:MAG: hypothetical protein ACREQN_12395 [Candidatus Binataceae bacterium]